MNIRYHHHLFLNREGCWDATDDFTPSFLHVSVFSTALWDLANSEPVHSLMLSSHLFLCLPCLLPPFNVQQDLADRRMANPMGPALSHHISQKRQPAAVPELPNNQPHQSSKQSHTEQIEATRGEDHRRRTGRLQSRKEYHRADLQLKHSM